MNPSDRKRDETGPQGTKPEKAVQVGGTGLRDEFVETAVKNGFVKADACREALAEAERTGRAVSDILVEKGLLTPTLAERIRGTAQDSEGRPTLRDFELISKLADGRMGAVYRAHQISLDRTVALKLIPRWLSRDERFITCFLREGKLAAELDHPNVVAVHEAGEAGGQYYLVMEFVEGQSVSEILKERGPLGEKEAIGTAIHVARALDYARKHDMTHGGIKPDNILVREDNTVKLSGFGLARSTLSHSALMAQSWLATATPYYISPERARGETDLDIQTDIYSLGAALYHMVTGEPPFSGTTARVVLTETPPLASEVNAQVSEDTTAVIATMMAKEREGRYADPIEVIEDLERVQRGEKPKAVLARTLAGLDAKGLEELFELRKRETTELKSALPVAEKRTVYLWIAAAAGGAILLLVLALALFGGREPTPERSADEIAASVEHLLQEGRPEDALRKTRAARSLFPDDARLVALEGRARAEMKKEEEGARRPEEARKRRETETKGA